MRLFWKITIPVVFVAVIGGASALWWVHQAKTNEQKLAEEARVCRVRAEQGDTKAQFELGNRYYYGQGVPQDYVEAARLYHEAADQGDAKAEYNLANLYLLGKGVPQDYAEALRWFRKPADQGNAMAEYEVGFMYHKGKGLAQDDTEAVRWYRKAADQGNVLSQNELGVMYHNGYGVPKDDTEAALWYRKAANQGYAPAESGIAFLEYYGNGVTQDRADATRWFRKAADQGNMYAQRSISIRLTTSRLVLLWARAILGLWLSLGFLLLNSFKPGRSLRNVRQSVIFGTGVLCLFSAGLGWYGDTHYKIRCLNCGLNTFTWLYWLLNGVLLALLIYIVLPAKKPGEEQVAIGVEETESVSEGKNNG
jgi:TPR repeat protein